MINGVKVVPLKQIPDERGKIMHMLRSDDPHFEKFGEIYFSVAYPGVIKAWHLHSEQTQNYAVVQGKIKLVLFDERDSSPTKGELVEMVMGDDNYCLVRIPPGIVNGFQAVSNVPAMVANCATLPHRPDEIERFDIKSKRVPYKWK